MANSRGRNRTSQPAGGNVAVMWGFIGLVVFTLLGVWLGAVGGALIANQPKPTMSPFGLFFDEIQGKAAWSDASWAIVAVYAVVLLGTGVAGWRTWTGGSRKGTRVDWTHGVLGHGREVAGISHRAVHDKAQRLGVEGDVIGLPIGRALDRRGTPYYADWESTSTLVAGPRSGKTTSYVVPWICEAPGAVIATSNKRDLVDKTRGVREPRGPVWVFDPQGICEEPANWWWNPLSYVVDETTAANLAQHFAAGSRAADAKTDSFFEPAGRVLLAGLLLAAALDDRSIVDVYRWLTRPSEDEAVRILEKHNFPLIADQVSGIIESPEKQRGGVYGTAQQFAACLTNRQTLEWVTDEYRARRHFDVEDFVARGGTLYSLSKEGNGSAGPLVTALTVAVVEAAERRGIREGGRLRLPLVGVLDEAANVCRWQDLPDLYSHYGSRGIVLMTVLQSPAQGAEVWGDKGFAKLWSASTTKLYGGGVSDERWLEELSKLIGTYDKQTSSVSVRSSSGLFGEGASVSRQLHRERILDVDDLQALPPHRAVVLSAGNRAAILRTIPYFEGRYAKAIEESDRRYNPGVH